MKNIMAKELKLLRIEKGLTIEEASKISQVATSTLSAYENGSRIMSIDVITKIVDSYGCTMLIFFERCIAKMQCVNA